MRHGLTSLQDVVEVMPVSLCLLALKPFFMLLIAQRFQDFVGTLKLSLRQALELLDKVLWGVLTLSLGDRLLLLTG